MRGCMCAADMEMSAPEVHILPTPEEAAQAAAEFVAALAEEKARAQGRFTIALSGGSTPRRLYQFLASTWPDYGVETTSDPLLQTVAAVRYIEDRYGTPAEALAFHRELHTVNGKRVHYY